MVLRLDRLLKRIASQFRFHVAGFQQAAKGRKAVTDPLSLLSARSL
jgi:hypothetical protein